MHVLDVVEQRAGGGILLAFRQLLDLTQGLLESFCHVGRLAPRPVVIQFTTFV
jgi:hypothetical protein